MPESTFADMARLAECRGVWAMWATAAAVVCGIAAVRGDHV